MKPEAWESSRLGLFSALVSFTGLIAVAIQMHGSTKQRKLDALHQATDVNRQLLSLGFDHPQLFDILSDTKTPNPEWERRYLQLWFNQLSLIHSHLKHGGFDAEFQVSLDRTIRDFMAMKNMQRHWLQNSAFYPASFQRLVNGILDTLVPERS